MLQREVGPRTEQHTFLMAGGGEGHCLRWSRTRRLLLGPWWHDARPYRHRKWAAGRASLSGPGSQALSRQSTALPESFDKIPTQR